MAYLIATMGTRDIQVPEKYRKEVEKIVDLIPSKINPDNYLIKEPFEGGKKCLEKKINSLFFDAPILFPGIQHILQDKGVIDTFYIVVTNQDERIVNEKHKRNDTFYFGKIFEEIIKVKFPKNEIRKTKIIALQEDISYYDKMYSYFTWFFREGAFKKIDPNDKLYILLQGGIDAINTSILLKSIEIFPNVEQLVKPDQAEGVLPLDFPDLFKQNFMSERIKHAVESYNYISIPDLTTKNFIRSLALFGHHLLNFNLENALKELDKCIKEGTEREKMVKIKNLLYLHHQNFTIKQKLWFLGVKTAYLTDNMSLFLLKIFTLSENILKPLTEKILGDSFGYDFKAEKHERWNNLIDKKPGLREYLNNIYINNNKLNSSYPNRTAYYYIARHENMIDTEMDKFISYTNTLAILRNRVAHELEGMDKKSIQTMMSKKYENFSLEQYIKLGDEIFNIKELDLLNEINEILIRNL